MNEKVEKVIDNIKSCSFDDDREENATKSLQLLEAKVKVKKKLFDLDVDYQKARNEVVISDKVQGKKTNEETRKAIVELELMGRFDSRDEYSFIIKIIESVERHNENILIMFFNGKER